MTWPALVRIQQQFVGGQLETHERGRVFADTIAAVGVEAGAFLIRCASGLSSVSRWRTPAFPSSLTMDGTVSLYLISEGPGSDGMNEPTSTDSITQLFAYGTLMPHASNYHVIEQYVLSWHRGTVHGVLVNLGCFPAMVPGHGHTRGVMLALDAAALARTDHLEGVPHFYQRTMTSVVLDNGRKSPAWVYVYADPKSIAGRPQLRVGTHDGVPVFEWSHPLAR
jgi:gamma-glutamylcyclotransferase (GGCT)/AIG2-like uncharacterized protein YtfP